MEYNKLNREFLPRTKDAWVSFLKRIMNNYQKMNLDLLIYVILKLEDLISLFYCLV